MAQNYEIGLVLNELSDDYDINQEDVVFGGGGKGQTATVEGYATGKGTSRLAAVQDLLRQVRVLEDATAPREDDLDFEGMTEGEAERCVAECVTSIKPYCECKCDGANHGAGVSTGSKFVATIGRKACKCGCGESTQRQFVPGHDARYHARIGLLNYAIENGLETRDIDEIRKVKDAALRKAARERRAAKRAKQAEVNAEILRKIAKSA